jgi:hypothetical protein
MRISMCYPVLRLLHTFVANEGKTMAIDEELLKPSREHLAQLRAQIASLEAETHEKIKRYGDDRARWNAFHLAVEPLRREQEAVIKVITNYYALQPIPPQIVIESTMEHIARDIRDDIFPKRSIANDGTADTLASTADA